MGGNGSYSKEMGGVPDVARTHIDTNHRVEGHKVLLWGNNVEHNKVIMNSNSENPIYLFASVEGKSGKIIISGISVYEKHLLTETIDLMFDTNGNIIPFNKTGKSSHSHKWKEVEPGKIGRKSHDGDNRFPIEDKYIHLIDKIVEFNKKGIVWNTE